MNEVPRDPFEPNGDEPVASDEKIYGLLGDLSRNLVAYRKNRSMSQERLASRAQISRETLRRIEVGGDTKVTTIEQLALALRTTAAALMDEDPMRKLPEPRPPYDQNGDRATPPYRRGKDKGLKLAHSGQPEEPSQLRLARVVVSPVDP